LEAFIRLENSLEKAMYQKTSPDTSYYDFGGIQLLPNNIYPYMQTTKSNDGIELEDYIEVNVKSTCGETLANIADYFFVENNFQDPDTGLPQITWKLLNVPFDFGKQLIYLEVKQEIGETFYTSPFMLTNDGGEFTSRIDYREKSTDSMQSVQVNMYYFDFDISKEYTQYWEVSTKNTQTNTIKSQRFEIFRTEVIDKLILAKIIESFDYRFTYLNLIRASIFEPVEIPRIEAKENFVQSDISFTFNQSEVYDPNYVTPIPPVPPIPENPPVMEITFLRKTFGEPGNYDMFFGFENFEPTYVAVQTSVNGGSYVSNTGGIDIPRVVNLGVTAGNYNRLRLFHEGLGLYSKNLANILTGNQLFGLIQEKVSETQYKFTLFFTEIGSRQTLTLTTTTPSGTVVTTESNSTGIVKTINITTGQAVTFNISDSIVGYSSSITVLAQTNS